MMIDLHSHILPGVDDGARTIEESMDMIRAARDQGFRGIILTPHYIANTDYQSRVKENKALFKALKKTVKDQGIDLFLFLGNEVCYRVGILKLIENGDFTTMNGSRYFLIETKSHLPDLFNFEAFLFKLQLKGYTTIIAHPERYDFVQKDPNVLGNLVAKGSLAQMNILSLTGFYGTRAQACAEILLTHNMVHFLASDAHKPKSYEEFAIARERAIDLVGEKKVSQMLKENPGRVLVDEAINISEPKRYEESKKRKRSLKSLWEK
ncbi:tyrosine-protein phosphatase [Acetobacterium sp.]|uniref:tyrosine-protein phosphatase n=1 Tax=Acetobacterium sp. TaxID=1872094 RepID=UPI002F41401B